MLLWLVPYVALLAWIASWQHESPPEESIGEAIGRVAALALVQICGMAVVTATWISLIAIAIWRKSTA